MLLFASLSLKAQIGKDFWFAAPDLDSQHAQSPVRFCVTTFDQAATVTFTQPANPLGYRPHTMEVPAHSYQLYDVSDIVNIVETQPYNTVLNFGFHITSDVPVSIYYESNNNNSEIYSLKGANALGFEFLVPSQYTYPNHYSTTCSRAEMVATEDDTELTIIPSVDLKGGLPAHQEIHVTLQKGQSYAVEAVYNTGDAHLRNTRIYANKPIAVNTSDDSVDLGGHYDLVGDQLVPISMLGTEYFAIKSGTGTEYLYFFPTEDATTISVNGIAVGTLNVGEEMSRVIDHPVVHVSANKPIAVFQLTVNSTGEMGGTVLPHVHCTGSLETSCYRPRLQDDSQMYVTVVVKTDKTGGFFVNGSPDVLTADDFTPVPSNPEYSYCLKNLSNVVPVESLLNMENRAGNGYFHLGVFITSDGTCTYGFFSDYQSFSKIEIDKEETGTEHCAGDDIIFNYQADYVNAAHLYGPGGIYLGQPPFVLNDVATVHTGRYYISGFDATSCVADSIWDFIDITVHQVPLQTTQTTYYYTEDGEPVRLVASGADRYEWWPTTGLSDPQTSTPLASPDVTTTYTLTGYKDFDDLTCETSMEVTVVVVPAAELMAVDDHFVLCFGQTMTLDCLGNDLPGNCTELTWDIVAPQHGTLNQTTWHYSPETGYAGEDHFSYTIHCGTRQSTAQVSIDIMPNFEAWPLIELCGDEANEWHGMTFTDDLVEWTHAGVAQSGCDSVYHLQFVHYPEYVGASAIDSSAVICDYFCFMNDTLRESGDYTYTFHTLQGCDSLVQLHLTINETLDALEIHPNDTIAPHWIIPATEFQVNTYDFHIYDRKHKYEWDSISWYIEEPVNWVLVPSVDGKSCSLYVLEYYPSTLHLKAKVYNSCSAEGRVIDYWLVCSFYGADENGVGEMALYPNPTHGQLTIEAASDIETVKVCNLMGQVCLQQDNIKASRCVIHLEGLPAALYVVEIVTQHGRAVRRIDVIR